MVVAVAATVEAVDAGADDGLGMGGVTVDGWRVYVRVCLCEVAR